MLGCGCAHCPAVPVGETVLQMLPQACSRLHPAGKPGTGPILGAADSSGDNSSDLTPQLVQVVSSTYYVSGAG